MNGKKEKNGTLSGPLILTVPIFSSIAILRPDWLQGSDQTAGPAKTHGFTEKDRLNADLLAFIQN
jgi:hypothetical protein